MLDAVGVHGISQQQGGRHQLLDDWLRALTDGVEAARGRAAVEPPLTFDLGYYGNLFLADWPTADKGPADPEVLEALADDLSEEERVWFAEIAAELPVEQAPPTKGLLPRMPRPVQRLAAWLDASFGAAAPIMFIGDLRQVRLYQQDDALARKVQGRVQEAMADGCTVLIGHSLGSVVAYETACAAEGRRPQAPAHPRLPARAGNGAEATAPRRPASRPALGERVRPPRRRCLRRRRGALVVGGRRLGRRQRPRPARGRSLPR